LGSDFNHRRQASRSVWLPPRSAAPVTRMSQHDLMLVDG
jgi:hypothetical protein